MSRYEIVRRAELNDRERKILFGWGEDVFDSARLGLTWRPAEHCLVCLDPRGEPVAHCGLLQHEITVGTRSLRVGGVGGVITVPARRGEGQATRLMHEAARIMTDEWQVAFGLLFCHRELETFYSALGWQRLSEPVTIEQPAGRCESPSTAMILPCRETHWPPGPVDLCSLPW